MFGIWSLFVSFLEQALLWFAVLTGSIGLGLIVFTICTRIIILPLTLSSIRSARRMQELQPQFKKLQRTYGKDQQRLQEETLKLYRQHKVNPVGGCLPMLLQLPLFIGVYQAVLHLMVPDQQQYLNEAAHNAVLEGNIELLLDQSVFGRLWQWINLESADTITTALNQPFLGLDLGVSAFSGGISDFNGLPYLVLPLLAVGLQFLQQLMAMPRTPDPQQKMMTQFMLFMPLFFVFIALTFPNGASIYWGTSSIIGVIQQFIVSGTGSLPNYLPFVPVVERWRPPQAEDDDEATGEGDGTGEGATAKPSRRTFDEVLRPLIDLNAASVSDNGHGNGSANEPISLDEAESVAASAGDGNEAPAEGSTRKPKPGTSKKKNRSSRKKALRRMQQR